MIFLEASETSGNGLFAVEVWCRPDHQGQSLGSTCFHHDVKHVKHVKL